MKTEKVVIALPEESEFVPSFKAWGKNYDWRNKDIVIVHVLKKQVYFEFIGNTEHPTDEEFEQLKPRIQEHIQSVAHEIIPHEANVDFKVEVLFSVSPAEEMSDYLKREKADTVVVASRKKTLLQGIYMNSFIDRLIQLSPCDIIIIRRHD